MPAKAAENVSVTLLLSMYVYSPVTTVLAVSITVIDGNFPKLCCMFQVVDAATWSNINVGTPCEDKVNTAKSYNLSRSKVPLPKRFVKFNVATLLF